MVEPFGQDSKAHAMDRPLDVSEGLSQGVCAVIPPQVDGIIVNGGLYKGFFARS